VALKPFREVNKDPSSIGELVVRPVRLWTVVAAVSERVSAFTILSRPTLEVINFIRHATARSPVCGTFTLIFHCFSK
jgi:hypothetical protein